MEEKLTSSPNYNRSLASATVDSIVAERNVDVKKISEIFINFSKKIIEELQRSTIYESRAPRWLRNPAFWRRSIWGERSRRAASGDEPPPEGGGFVDFGAALFTESYVLTWLCSDNPLARRAARTRVWASRYL